MKISKRQLAKIIREEKRRLLRETGKELPPGASEPGKATASDAAGKLGQNAVGPGRGNTFAQLAMDALVAGDAAKAANAVMDAWWIDDIWPEQQAELEGMLAAIPPQGAPEEITMQIEDASAAWINWLRNDWRKREAQANESRRRKGRGSHINEAQLRRIIRQEKARLLKEEGEVNGQAHHYPTLGTEWENAAVDLAGEWEELEIKAFDQGDPSMMGNAETKKEAQEYWEAQVAAATEQLEERLIERMRTLAMQVMEEISNELINGDYA